MNYGQHDSGPSAVYSQPYQQPMRQGGAAASNDLATSMDGMSLRGGAGGAYQPQPTQWRQGQPLVRHNSHGAEETFVDAET